MSIVRKVSIHLPKEAVGPVEYPKGVVLSAAEVSRRLPWHPDPSTVRNWAREHKIPGAFRSPGGHWYFPEEEVDKMMKVNRYEA